MANYLRKQALNISDKGDQFPTLCDACMGDSQFLTMKKDTMGAECKMCTRVYTQYRWKNDPKASQFKKTVICPVCSNLHNKCQGCLIDLEYNVPSYVRNSLFETTEANPNDTTNVISQRTELSNILQSERALDLMESENPLSRHQLTMKGAAPSRQKLLDIARSQDVFNVYTKDSKLERLVPPSDVRIKTLYLGNLERSRQIGEDTLQKHLKTYGTIESIKMKNKCAFVTFINRKDAEMCAETLYNRFTINGHPISLRWAMKKSGPRESKGAAITKPKHVSAATTQAAIQKPLNLKDIHPGIHLLGRLQPHERPPLPPTLNTIYPPHLLKADHIQPPCQNTTTDLPNYPTLQRVLALQQEE